MAGYAALGRVEGGRVRALAWAGPVPDLEALVDTAAPAITMTETSPRPAARPMAEIVREHAGILREQWSMTTFYLFDPESWR